MKRLNITLPEDLALALDGVSNKSRFIAQALREKLERDRKKMLEALLMEGYQATSEEDKELNQEWEEITLEGWK